MARRLLRGPIMRSFATRVVLGCWLLTVGAAIAIELVTATRFLMIRSTIALVLLGCGGDPGGISVEITTTNPASVAELQRRAAAELERAQQRQREASAP
jgi:hypothetical protein